MSSVSAINVLVGANIKDFTRKMKTVRGDVDANKKKFKALASTIATVGVGAISAVGVMAVKSAMSMETLATSFKIMTGSAEKSEKVLKSLTDFTAKTPFQLEQVAGAARQLIAATGETENLNQELKILGDLASVTAVPLGDMAKIYTKAFNKGKLQAEELNQLAERGVPIIAELAKMYGVTKKEIFKMGEQGVISFEDMRQAMVNMTSEGGIAFNAMEAQSKTLAGQISTLKDNVYLLSAEIGQHLIPFLNDAAKGMLDMFSDTEPAIEAFKKMKKAGQELRDLQDELANPGFFYGGDENQQKKIDAANEALAFARMEWKAIKIDAEKAAEAAAKVVPPTSSTTSGDGSPKTGKARGFKLTPDPKAYDVAIEKVEEFDDSATDALEHIETQAEKTEKAIKGIGEGFRLVGDLASSYSQIQNNQADADLRNMQDRQQAEIEAVNEKYANSSNSARMSKEEISKLEEQHAQERAEAKRKAGRDAKQAARLVAIVNTAAGVARAFGEHAWPYSMAVAAGVAAKGAAEIAVINSQPDGYQAGGIVGSGGTYMVGERGPEMVTMPAGAQVTPNHALGGGGNLMARVDGNEFVVWLDKQQARNVFRS